ncbi:lipopolysaccharide biosynthesis protein [Fusobacterium sp. HC1336]|uniref:lipopolysaccharide biosynthesis protein n=1 Tax=Fusobacterium sp. HC1336 TaxID=3171169 RepID=UPI003F287666
MDIRLNILMKQFSSSFILKILAMGLSYISIPLFLKYLGDKDYGIWMTIFSVVSWINTFDLGIANGLKNKLAENYSKKNFQEMKEYIMTSYVSLSFLALTFWIIGCLGIYFFNFSQGLNIGYYSENYLKLLFFITYSLTLINFIVKIYNVLYLSVHNSYTSNLCTLLFQILFILILIILNKVNKISLISIVFIYPGFTLILGIIFTVIFFKKYKNMKPKLKDFRKEKIKMINGLGLYFFLIQISMLIIMTTDNMIIMRYLGAEEVATYSIISKLFQAILIIETLISAPMWPLFIDAYVKSDKKWIIKIYKKLNLLFFLTILGVGLLIVITPLILKIWIGKELIIPKYLTLFWGIFILNRIWGDIYCVFTNATNKIKLQMWLLILGAVINIPLSIYLLKYLNFGSSGVILATNVSLLPISIIIPIQVYKIIKNMKHEDQDYDKKMEKNIK